MFYKTLSLWLCFSLSSIGFAQDAFYIKGIVANANTLQPIEGANIIGKGVYSTSSVTGTFTLKKVSKGTHTFTISRLGYVNKTFTIKVSANIDGYKIYLEEATTELQKVEITGKSRKRADKESPTVSQFVTEDFLIQNRENSLMQTLSKIPGVSTIKIGSGQSKPVIRGLGFNRVAVVQNGIKHEAQQWGNDHGLEIDQYGIENIKIIKGPASLVYGSDAIAGVVDIQQNKIPLKNTFNGDVNLLGESNNDLLGISAGITTRKDKWFYRARLTYRDYGDYKVPTNKINYENYIFELHDNNLRNTAGREANASFSFGYVSNKITSETTISNVNAKNGFFANAHGLEVRTSSIDYDASNRDIDLPYHKVNHFKVTNNTKIDLETHTVNIDLGYQNNDREEHSEPIPHGYMPTPPNSKERRFQKNTWSLNIKDAFQPNSKHHIETGINIEYQDNNIDGWGFLIPAYTRFSAGAFVFNQFEINSNLHVLAGIRYDFGNVKSESYVDWYPSTVNNADSTTSNIYLQRAQDKTLNFGNISASAGLSYLLKNTTFKINIGKSFRMPLANELASDGVNYHMYRYEKGNLDLNPEESYQLDIDIDHTTKNVSVGVSPFLNYFENFIYLNPTSNYFETLQIYEYTQNKVFRAGAEFRASTSIINNLTLNASAEYVYSRQINGPKKGFTIPFSPPLSGLFSARYQFKDFFILKAPQLTADYRITAAQDEIVPPEEKTDGYSVLNMAVFTQIDVLKTHTPLEIRLKLNNVFDTKYYNHTSFYRLIDVPEAGRNISVSLTQKL